MTKQQRIILFLICAFLFVISAVAVIFYSQGFRLDLKNRRIAQTGAFYFKVLPKNAQIFLDGKLKKRTDFLFSSALIENLLARKYRVEIKKEGYFTWEKTLEAKEKEATEAKNIILIKKNPNLAALADGIDQFFFSPDEKKMVLLENTRGNEGNWELKLYDLKLNIKSHLIKSSDIAKGGADFIDLDFSPDSKTILLKVGLKEKDSHYLIDLENTPTNLSALDFLGKNIEKIVFQPKGSKKLFFLNQGKMGEADLSQRKTSTIPVGTILDFAVFDGGVYYLESTGHLYQTDFAFASKNKLNETSLSVLPETKYEIKVLSDSLFVKEENKLYLLDAENKKFNNLLDKNNFLKISPDSEKIVYASDFEIWILFLKEQLNQPQKKKGEKMFLTRFSEPIEDIFWLNSHYLIFSIKGKIKIAEIDDRDRINIVDLAEFKEPTMHFNQPSKKFYVLSEGKLLSSESLW